MDVTWWGLVHGYNLVTNTDWGDGSGNDRNRYDGRFHSTLVFTPVYH